MKTTLLRAIGAILAGILLAAVLCLGAVAEDTAGTAETLFVNGGEETVTENKLYSVLTLRAGTLAVKSGATLSMSGMLSMEGASTIDVYGTLDGKVTLLSLVPEEKTGKKPTIRVYDGAKIDVTVTKAGWGNVTPEQLVVYAGESEEIKVSVTEEQGNLHIVCDATGIKTLLSPKGKWLIVGAIAAVVAGVVAAAVIVGIRTKNKNREEA